MKIRITLIVITLFGIWPALTSQASATSITFYVEDKQVKNTIDPFIKSGRTFVEAHSFFEALGLTMHYDSKTKIRLLRIKAVTDNQLHIIGEMINLKALN